MKIGGGGEYCRIRTGVSTPPIVESIGLAITVEGDALNLAGVTSTLYVWLQLSSRLNCSRLRAAQRIPQVSLRPKGSTKPPCGPWLSSLLRVSEEAPRWMLPWWLRSALWCGGCLTSSREKRIPKTGFRLRNRLVWQPAVCFQIFDDVYRQRGWERGLGKGGNNSDVADLFSLHPTESLIARHYERVTACTSTMQVQFVGGETFLKNKIRKLKHRWWRAEQHELLGITFTTKNVKLAEIRHRTLLGCNLGT